MKSKLILATAVIFMLPSLAFARFPINTKKNCARPTTSNSEHFRDLVNNVNVMNKDDRKYIDEFEFSPEIANADKIKERLRLATGFAGCDFGQEDQKKYGKANNVTSGFLIKFKNKIFACASAHTFIADSGDVFGNGEGCFFQNQAVNPISVSLDLSVERFIVPTRNTDAEPEKDLACARLKKDQQLPPDVEKAAFEIAGANICPQPGQKMYAVSALEDDMMGRLNDPILRPLEVKQFVGPARDLYFVHDGDALNGSSGGMNFVINGGNVLACGAITGGANAAVNGLPFLYLGENDVGSYVRSLGFGPETLRQLSAMANDNVQTVMAEQERVNSGSNNSTDI